MWKPNVVIPEHRYRARIVWAGLLLSITAYTIWQVWKIFDGLNNPSTSLEVMDETYNFPYVLVCFFHGFGCGYEDESTYQCPADALSSANVYFNGEEVEDVVEGGSFSNCLGFDLTKIDVKGSEVAGDEAYASLYMAWPVTDSASTEINYYDAVATFISDKEPEEDTLSFLYVPYTRYLPQDFLVNYAIAEMTIGKTTKKNLAGEITTSFPPLILSRSEYTTTNADYVSSSDSFSDVAYGRLFLDIRQGPFSRSYITELSPLDIGNFLGNIGGFWELLLIFWGLFFIATRTEAPKMKARNFTKSIQKGTEIVTKRRSLSVDSSTSASGVEARPHWEAAYRGNNSNSAPAAGTSTGGGASRRGTAAAVGFPILSRDNGGTGSTSVAARRASSRNGSTSSGHYQTADGSSSSQRRPAVSDVPRRESRPSGAPPASQASGPPSYEAMAAI